MAGTSFPEYLARQIYTGKLDKDTVIKSYPKFAEEIQKYLDEWNSQIPYVPGR